MITEWIIETIEELDAIADVLIEKLETSKIIAFNAPMGAGKTTLIKIICKKLGAKDTISSPTFSIVNEYQLSSKKKIFHFDFYRIKSLAEVYDMGYEDYFYSNNYCFIEWPEMLENLLPETVLKVEISMQGTMRKFSIE
jgi:tRNA threonylcarbamoyladenosine biosynthesis protein TsaE